MQFCTLLFLIWLKLCSTSFYVSVAFPLINSLSFKRL